MGPARAAVASPFCLSLNQSMMKEIVSKKFKNFGSRFSGCNLGEDQAQSDGSAENDTLKSRDVVKANQPAKGSLLAGCAKSDSGRLLNYGPSQITAMSLTAGNGSFLGRAIERSGNSINTRQDPCGSGAVSWIFREDFGQDHFLVLHPAELKADLHR